MIGYVTLGTNDLERASGFYDGLFSVLGAGRLMQNERYVFWGVGMDKPAVCVIKPFDGQAATVGNGVMVSLVTDSIDKVDAVHRKAVALGGKDEGAPGLRGSSGIYMAYFRDLDGNKLAAFCIPKA